MKTNLVSLQKSLLFSNIGKEELEKLYKCISAQEKFFERGSFVFHVGDDVRFVYFILSGSMHIVNEDYWGNQFIIETMNKDTLFGEAYVFSGRKNQLVGVNAAEDTYILEINPTSLFETCPCRCSCHSQLVRNTLNIVSEKIVRLTEKLGHVMRRTTREKILSYLSKCAQQGKSNLFYIPYTRQQLADYLCVDRSALSNELSKLQAEGMIKFNKNQFELFVNHDEII